VQGIGRRAAGERTGQAADKGQRNERRLYEDQPVEPRLAGPSSEQGTCGNGENAHNGQGVDCSKGEMRHWVLRPSRQGPTRINRHVVQRRSEGPPSIVAALVRLRPYAALIVLVVALSGWWLLHGPDDSPAAAGQVTQVPTLDAGRALYLQGCAACHGPAGEGTSQGPSLVRAGAADADFQLRTGRMPLSAPGAPPVRQPPAYSEDQINAIVAYVASLGPGPAIPNVVASGGDLARGRQLYIANCAACHGAAGAGGTVGGGFVAPPLDRADPRIVGEAVIVGPGPMPAFAFDQQELNDLAAYVELLHHPPHPGGLPVAEVGPVAEGFLAGAVGIVTLLAVARWIGRSPSR
jgi:ubiquinol-cytochrome c reductase cytochrome c subunit